MLAKAPLPVGVVSDHWTNCYCWLLGPLPPGMMIGEFRPGHHGFPGQPLDRFRKDNIETVAAFRANDLLAS
jgi:hypothetical protein